MYIGDEKTVLCFRNRGSTLVCFYFTNFISKFYEVHKNINNYLLIIN